MTQLGADPDQLKALATQFRRASVELGRSQGAIEAQLRRSGWNGPDAHGFRSAWSARHRPLLGESVELCRRVSKQLDRHADEQILTSGSLGAAGTATHTGTGGPSVRSGGNLGGRPDGHAPAPPRIPNSIDSLQLGVEATVASILGSSKHQVTIQAFDGDRHEITITDVDAVGAKGSVGASFKAGGAVDVDLGGSTKGTIGMVTRRTYVTDGDSVNAMVAYAEAARASRRAVEMSPMAIPLQIAGGVFSWVADRVGLPLDLLPEPSRVETLAEVAVSGKLAADLPVGSELSAKLTGVLRAGTADVGDDRSYVFEAEGAVAHSLGASLGFLPMKANSKPSVSNSAKAASGRIRIEYFDDRDDRRATVTTESVQSSAMHRSVTTIDLSGERGERAASSLLDAVEKVRDARVTEAIDSVRSIEFATESLTTRSATFDIDTTHDNAAGASVGEGATIGLEGTATVTRFERR
ncbi:MAG: hypothetical protein R2735_11655 [Microthrixaceae bacterium]